MRRGARVALRGGVIWGSCLCAEEAARQHVIQISKLALVAALGAFTVATAERARVAWAASLGVIEGA